MQCHSFPISCRHNSNISLNIDYSLTALMTYYTTSKLDNMFMLQNKLHYLSTYTPVEQHEQTNSKSHYYGRHFAV